MERKFDRKIPRPLPMHRMLRKAPISLPPTADHGRWCGPVKDQGNEGACTAHAGTSGVEWIFRKHYGRTPVFSPQYTYAKELMAQGDFPNDVGSDGLTLCKSLVFNGCCEASLFPYVPGEIARPTAEQDDNAEQFQMGAYHGVLNSATFLSVLGDPVPWPVAIGFSVFESFMSDLTARTGVMTLPQHGERLLGGHEVLAVGYDASDVPIIRPQAAPPSALCLNSWGENWGKGGFFWMPLEILDLVDTDMKIFHAGRPW